MIMKNEIEKKNKEFIPNKKQLQYANIYCDIKSRYDTEKDRAEKIGVSRMQIYRWHKDPEFEKWLEDRAQKTIDKARGILLLHGLRESLKRGGFNYWKVMAEITGIYTPNLKLEAILKPPELPFIYYKDDKPEAIETNEEVKKIEGGKNDK